MSGFASPIFELARPIGVIFGRSVVYGESLWSILHRLAHANGFNRSEILALSGRRPHSKTESLRTRVSLDEFGGIDRQRLASLIGTSSETLGASEVRSYDLSGSSQNRLSRIGIVRFCPDCRRMGLHLAIHQLQSLDACPWHQQRLEFRCPKCDGEIAHELTIGCRQSNCDHGREWGGTANSTPMSEASRSAIEHRVARWLEWCADRLRCRSRTDPLDVRPVTKAELAIDAITTADAELAAAVRADIGSPERRTSNNGLPRLNPRATVTLPLTTYAPDGFLSSHFGADRHRSASVFTRIMAPAYLLALNRQQSLLDSDEPYPQRDSGKHLSQAVARRSSRARARWRGLIDDYHWLVLEYRRAGLNRRLDMRPPWQLPGLAPGFQVVALFGRKSKQKDEFVDCASTLSHWLYDLFDFALTQRVADSPDVCDSTGQARVALRKTARHWYQIGQDRTTDTLQGLRFEWIDGRAKVVRESLPGKGRAIA